MNFLKLFRHPPGLTDLTPDALETHLAHNPVVIDVRTPQEFRAGHIRGAISVPLGQEHQVIQKWAVDTDVVLICKTGHRSQAAGATLLEAGFQRVSHLKGGLDGWRRAGKPTEQ